jgi:Asp-tRNA(Asn)/Glu-tRNA(Gln) amidotransferase A subunit family amidase
LQQDLQAGRTDPVRLLQRYLARIDAIEDRVQGWRIIDRDGALTQAKRRQQATGRAAPGLLHGIPIAIKDIIDVAGFRRAPAAAAASRLRRARATRQSWLDCAGSVQ